jgi:hypothetical protein
MLSSQEKTEFAHRLAKLQGPKARNHTQALFVSVSKSVIQTIDTSTIFYGCPKRGLLDELENAGATKEDVKLVKHQAQIIRTSLPNELLWPYFALFAVLALGFFIIVALIIAGIL